MTQILLLKLKRLVPAAKWLIAALMLPYPMHAQNADNPWIRPQKQGDPLVWGRRDGIVFGLASPDGMPGPRGLIRVGLYTADSASPQLINFIAVEPVIKGVGTRISRLGFSELEMSELDPGERGRRMWVHGDNDTAQGDVRGNLETIHSGRSTVERLSVRIDVERYTSNGAHVYVIASIDSDHPAQLRLTPVAENDSAPIEELTLTATMGNFERLRWLWLDNQIIRSDELFANYTENAFVESQSYPLPQMLRTGDGDAIVFCTSDETNPRYSLGNDTAHWVYNLPKITQYWLVPGSDVEPNLRVRVNARHVYWGSEIPVLGGIAFENFEVRERYVRGQSFIFGITPKTPSEFYQGSSHLAKSPAPNPISREVPQP